MIVVLDVQDGVWLKLRLAGTEDFSVEENSEGGKFLPEFSAEKVGGASEKYAFCFSADK